jgi:hypothetical protein
MEADITNIKTGRPPFEITDDVLELVKKAANNGLNLKEIAGVLGISETTLYEKKKEFPEFTESIEGGRANGIATIKNVMYEKAKAGDNHCMTMYLKNYSDLVDKHDISHQGGITVNMPQNAAATL